MNKVTSGLLLFIFLTSTLTFASSVRSVSADGTIYIRADGSIDPSTAPISTLDNVTYTLTGNITSNTDGIIVERDNIVLNGAGYSMTGSGNGNGTTLTDRNNVTVRNITIKNFHYGIPLYFSDNNALIGNNVADNYDGIDLYSSSGNALSDNNVTANNYEGIELQSSSSNAVSNNNVANNANGISLDSSCDNNTLSGNNVTASNYVGIYLGLSSNNNTLSGNNLTANNEAVILFSSSDNTLSGNNVANNYNGIEFGSSDNNVLSQNNVTGSAVLGIYLASSSNNTLFGNNVTATQLFGIELASCSSSTLSSNNVANNYYGIFLDSSSDNVLFGNDVANNYDGIDLEFSSGNALSDNNVANNGYGIVLGFSISNNVLFGNNVMTNSVYGIALFSSDNSVFHNNFVGNSGQVLSANSSNTWDDGYPSGGNYWSDYNGTDSYSGLFQNIPGSDGIGDTPYIIDANNTDGYPLMNPWTPLEHDVAIISVSSLKTVVGQGYSLNISVTAENQGGTPETFDVAAYYGNGTFTPEQWNEFWSRGDCNRDGYINIVDAQILADNFDWVGPLGGNPADLNSDGKVDIWDAAILASNFGKQIWGFFLSTIGRVTVSNLAGGDSAASVFIWNTTGVAYGNYTVSVVAGPVTNETYTIDNNCTCTIQIHVGVPGDISSSIPGVYDGVDNMKDIAYLVSLFNTRPISSNWNPNADINNDGVCNMKDIAIAVLHFNEHE